MKTLPILCLVALAASSHGQHTTLAEALRSARSNRPALQAAQLRLEQARLSAKALGAYPATRLAVGYTTDPETGGTDEDLMLSQPIDLFGRTDAFRAAGDALVAEAEAAYRQTALQVQSEVINAYLDAVAAAELAKSAAAVQALYERLHEATRLRVEGGVAPGFHLTQIELDLEQAQLRTERQRSEAHSALQRLESVSRILDLENLPPGFPDLDAETEIIKYPERRPDLRLLSAQFQQAEAAIDVTRASGAPYLELQLRKNPWQADDPQLGLRIQLYVPLFDRGRLNAETDAARAKAKAAREAMMDALHLAHAEVVSALIELRTAQRQMEDYEALVRKAQGLVERLHPGLTEGATTLLEVLDATRALRDIEQAYVEAKARLARAQAELIRATGQIIEETP